MAFFFTGEQTVHTDDIVQKVGAAFYGKLIDGPVNGLLTPYLYTITRRKAADHMKELAKRAEEFVGDDTARLEDKDAYISVNLASKVEFDQAMAVLREELSPLQLKAFVLAEAYQLQAPKIAKLLGTSPESVRDALRHARSKLRTRRVGLRLGVLVEE
ncbi:sigma factor-like helix-turn-helix DNA-binding protein [Streptomyces sp900105245]|uniref:Sigma factor-like helix-turn-helix DNA-binding protein n=1 Tax=Streptomyces sp. 900105245 TaxID=3154379 RepID=A0ABV1UMH9_9ACTN